MNLLEDGKYKLTNLSKINILLGKNGCGKSTLLKQVEQSLTDQGTGEVNYVTPERGGALHYEAGVEQNVITGGDWSKNAKRVNQWGQFKNYSVAQYRKLETLVLREIANDHQIRGNFDITFDSTIAHINDLLTNIKIVSASNGVFELRSKETNAIINPYQISSGESELIALAIECLAFEKICDSSKKNYLLLDEPDVHLHPDLQSKLVVFLVELVKKNKFSIIIATHSTAILGALVDFPDSRFAILTNKSIEASFKPLSETYRNILPIFGAHPLSNLFNQSPIMLVEGDDDVRIWQQAIRTTEGKLKFYPCSTGTISKMNDYEVSVNDIIRGVYDNAKAFSLRDKDDGSENIDDFLTITRFKLSCRAAENLFLTDEVLISLGTTWEALKSDIEQWLVSYPNHKFFAEMQAFKKSKFNRKEFHLKDIRNIIIGLATSKPWEVAVGQTIGKLFLKQLPLDFGENKLSNYLGKKLMSYIRTD